VIHIVRVPAGQARAGDRALDPKHSLTMQGSHGQPSQVSGERDLLQGRGERDAFGDGGVLRVAGHEADPVSEDTRDLVRLQPEERGEPGPVGADERCRPDDQDDRVATAGDGDALHAAGHAIVIGVDKRGVLR
jgi:hypothetical protein